MSHGSEFQYWVNLKASAAQADVPLTPKAHMPALATVLPQKHRPLRLSSAHNARIYLASISKAMAAVLCHLLAEQLEDIAAIASPKRLPSHGLA